MNDKELLTLTAKAAGLHHPDGFEWITNELGFQWNPLTDDGDALRLAVKLGLLFKYMIDRYELFMRFYCEELDNDLKPSEATRRAIVRAAAEIGKEQK